MLYVLQLVVNDQGADDENDGCIELEHHQYIPQAASLEAGGAGTFQYGDRPESREVQGRVTARKQTHDERHQYEQYEQVRIEDVAHVQRPGCNIIEKGQHE